MQNQVKLAYSVKAPERNDDSELPIDENSRNTKKFKKNLKKSVRLQNEEEDSERGLLDEESVPLNRQIIVKDQKEEEERVPLLIQIFQWSLIVAGFIALCIALFIMGEVIYNWSLVYNG